MKRLINNSKSKIESAIVYEFGTNDSEIDKTRHDVINIGDNVMCELIKNSSTYGVDCKKCSGDFKYDIRNSNYVYRI